MQKKTPGLSPLARNVLVLAVKIIGIVVVLTILLFGIFGFSYVETNAMSPSISGGDLVLTYHLDRNFIKGDAVVYHCGDKKCVGRVMATPGETIEVDSDNRIYINNRLEDSDYYLRNVFPADNNIKYPYAVNEGELFILGDNRLEYDDSRSFGAIKSDDIEGKIIGLFRTHGL